MTKNVLIMAANGQISQIIEQRILTEAQFSDVHLTLFLRKKSRLNQLVNNERVTLIEGSLDSMADIQAAVAGQDIVFVGVVDQTADNSSNAICCGRHESSRSRALDLYKCLGNL